jgi:hypothetical protein
MICGAIKRVNGSNVVQVEERSLCDKEKKSEKIKSYLKGNSPLV